jgi:hypothetical protein
MPRDWQYRLNGELLHGEAIAERGPNILITALAADRQQEGIVEVFAAERDFDEWARAERVEDMVGRVRQTIAEGERERQQPRQQDEQRYRRETERVRRELVELARRERLRFEPGDQAGERPDALALLRRAKERGPNEPKIFDSGILFEHANYGGRWLPIVYVIPDFTWVDFNDMCSSFVFWGGGVLFEHSWYGGRQFWMFGGGAVPWIGSDFNDIASSAILIG